MMQDNKARLQKVERFKELLSGNKNPETLEDDIFLSFFEDGVMDTNLMESYLTICDDPNIMELELHAALIGYSLGQSQGQYLIGDENEPKTH